MWAQTDFKIFNQERIILENMNNGENRAGGHTAHNLGMPAGGIRRPQLRRLTRWGRRSCGNPWSLSAMPPWDFLGWSALSTDFEMRSPVVSRVVAARGSFGAARQITCHSRRARMESVRWSSAPSRPRRRSLPLAVLRFATHPAASYTTVGLGYGSCGRTATHSRRRFPPLSCVSGWSLYATTRRIGLAFRCSGMI